MVLASYTLLPEVVRLSAHLRASGQGEGVLEERGLTRGHQGALVLQPAEGPAGEDMQVSGIPLCI